MLVVSDATPVNILLRIGCAEVLPKLFGEVVIPTAVAQEMRHPQAPQVVRECSLNLPSWLLVRSPARVDPSLRLGAGEREALALAAELHADLLLVDDRKARRTAEAMGLRITGTLGVLLLAAARNLLDLDAALDSLQRTDFSIAPELIEELRRRQSPG